MFRYNLRTLLIVLALGPPVLAYVGSYYILSRRGFREADQYGFKGFYFVTPVYGGASERANQQRFQFYWPLIQLDILLGTGRHPAADPMWGMAPDTVTPNRP
jgi:hypothetical protein